MVKFERTGPRVLLINPNYRFRAICNDAAERRFGGGHHFAQFRAVGI